MSDVFADWLDLPAGLGWLEVGCGTGALTAAVVAAAHPGSVLAVDTTAAYLAAAREGISDERVSFEVAAADRLPVAGRPLDVAVSALVLKFLPDAVGALREQAPAVSVGGTVAVFVWDYAEGMRALRLFWEAAVVVDPESATPDEAMRFPICRPGPLAKAWQDAGLVDVRVDALEVQRSFASFDDLWAQFLRGHEPAGSYLDSLDDVGWARVGEAFVALVPRAPDGTAARELVRAQRRRSWLARVLTGRSWAGWSPPPPEACSLLQHPHGHADEKSAG